MSNNEAIKMLKARLECITNLVGDKCSYCDDCKLCSAQGNLTEQKECLNMAIKSLEADRAIEKTLYAIREEMQFIKVAELQIYGANSWRFSNAIEEIIDKHLSEVSE